MRSNSDIHQTLGCLGIRLFTFGNRYRIGKHLQIHLISDRFHVSMLLCTQNISGTPDLQISHRDSKS